MFFKPIGVMLVGLLAMTAIAGCATRNDAGCDPSFQIPPSDYGVHALLSQMKLIDAKRLIRKVGYLDKNFLKI